MPPQNYSRIEPLSQAEMEWAQKYFDRTHDSKWVSEEYDAMETEGKIDDRFANVAYYIFRQMYRDPEAPPPLPEDVDHSAAVFQRIAPNWWRTMGLRIFR
jgi:hypothetical protein